MKPTNDELEKATIPEVHTDELIGSSDHDNATDVESQYQ